MAVSTLSSTNTARPVRPGPVDLGRESNGQVARRALKGDERAWTELVSRFGTTIRRVAQGTGLNIADAADAQQATWIRFMRHADQIRDLERIGPWLATTARRESLRIAKAAGRQALSANPVEEYGSSEGGPDDVEALVLRDHYNPELERALSRLHAPNRRVIELLTSDWLLSYGDIAKVMDLPVGSIGPMRLRGLQMLRRDADLQDHAWTCAGAGFSTEKEEQ
jgi:RNA polymerase sigma factor (sigma-70 family)